MDVQPVHPGHTVVIPKRHAVSLANLDDADGVAMWSAGVRLAAAVRRSDERCEASVVGHPS